MIIKHPHQPTKNVGSFKKVFFCFGETFVPVGLRLKASKTIIFTHSVKVFSRYQNT